MDILKDLRTTTFSNNEAFFKKADCEIEQLRTENAALKEQVAQREIEYNWCSAMLNNAERTVETLEETIAQQADVIEQMREALRHYAYRAGQDWQIAREALALQPSPEILEARDQRVAEACKAACENERLGEIIGDSDQAYENAITHCSQAIDSKEWRKYL